MMSPCSRVMAWHEYGSPPFTAQRNGCDDDDDDDESVFLVLSFVGGGTLATLQKAQGLMVFDPFEEDGTDGAASASAAGGLRWYDSERQRFGERSARLLAGEVTTVAVAVAVAVTVAVTASSREREEDPCGASGASLVSDIVLLLSVATSPPPPVARGWLAGCCWSGQWGDMI